MRLHKGKIVKTEGPKIEKIRRHPNVRQIHRNIVEEMNERHKFYRELDGISMSDIFNEDEDEGTSL